MKIYINLPEELDSEQAEIYLMLRDYLNDTVAGYEVVDNCISMEPGERECHFVVEPVEKDKNYPSITTTDSIMKYSKA